MEDCSTISYISKKLETLPLSEFFFSTRTSSGHSCTNKDLFNVSSSAVSNLTKHAKPTWSFDFSKTLIEKYSHTEDFEKQKNKNVFKQHNAIPTKKTCRHANPVDNNCQPTTSVDISDVKNSIQLPKCKEMIYNKPKSNRFSPVHSDSLPTKRSVKTFPNKRKRSSEESISCGDISTLAHSCDLEIWESHFSQDIQRTLSFDEELLRCDEEIAAFTARSTSSSHQYRSRPSIRMTCKSQPSTLDDFRILHPRARKVKVIQLKPDFLKSDLTADFNKSTSFNFKKSDVAENIFKPIH